MRTSFVRLVVRGASVQIHPRIPFDYFKPLQRVRAAFLAICFRRLAVNAFFRALPPAFASLRRYAATASLGFMGIRYACRVSRSRREMQSYRRRVVCMIRHFVVDRGNAKRNTILALPGVAVRCHAMQGDDLPRKGTRMREKEYCVSNTYRSYYRQLCSRTPCPLDRGSVDSSSCEPAHVRNLLSAGELARRKVGSRTITPGTSVEAFLRKDHATGEGKRKRRRKN